MSFIKSIRDLTFEEEVTVLQSLLKDVKGITRDRVLDILSFWKFNDIQSYMDDIGIVISYDQDDIHLHTSTIGSDSKWGEAKIQLLYNHLYARSIGGY